MKKVKTKTAIWLAILAGLVAVGVLWYNGWNIQPIVNGAKALIFARAVTPTPLPTKSGPDVEDVMTAAEQAYQESLKLDDLVGKQADINAKATDVAVEIATQKAVVATAEEVVRLTAGSLGTPMPTATPSPTPTVTPTTP